MALKILSPLSLISPNPHSSSSPFPSPSPLHFPFKSKLSIKSLKPISSSSSPIFLPHLEQPQPNPQQEIPLLHQQQHHTAINIEEEDDDELELDPIHAFCKTRSQTQPQDPEQEGRVSLQRNRRSSWHIASIETDPAEKIPFPEDPEAELAATADNGGGGGGGGAVEDILKISRNIPENSTLGDYLGSYVGKISEDECVEILVRMGDEGLMSSGLYLFEWMRLQEPSLVSPRACSVIFPALGLAGMGEDVKVLFDNLPREKEFRDVRVYNAAISGLSASRR